MKRLGTIKLIAFLALASNLAIAEGGFFNANQEYSEQLMQTYKAEAAASIERSELLSKLRSAQLAHSSASSRYSSNQNAIDSYQSKINQLEARDSQIDYEIRQLRDELASTRRRAARDLNIVNGSQPAIQNHISELRSRTHHIRGEIRQVENQISRKLNSNPYSGWVSDRNQAQRQKRVALNELSQKKNQLRGADNQIAALQRQNASYKNTIVKQESAVSQLQQQLPSLEQAAAAAKQEWENCKAQKKHPRACLREAIKARQAQNKVSNTKKKISSYKSTIAKHQRSIESNRSKIVELRQAKQRLPNQISRLESKVASLNSEISSLQNRINTFVTNQIRPLNQRKERLEGRLSHVQRRINVAQSYISQLQNTRDQMVSVENERQRIPGQIADARRDLAYEQSLSAELLEHLNLAKVQKNKAQSELNEFDEAQKKLWALLSQKRAASDAALSADMAEFSNAPRSVSALSDKVGVSDSYKDWELIVQVQDPSSGAMLCVAQTTASSGESLQVLKIKDAVSGQFTRGLVRVVMNEAVENASPVVKADVKVLRGASAKMRRFELSNSYRAQNVLVLGAEDAKSMVDSIRKLSKVELNAMSYDRVELEKVEFSLRGSMKTVDKMFRECR